MVSNLIVGINGHPQLIPSGLSKMFEWVNERKKGKKKTQGLVIHSNMLCCFVCYFDVPKEERKKKEYKGHFDQKIRAEKR